MSWLSDGIDVVGGWFGDDTAGTDSGNWFDNIGSGWGSSSTTTPATTTTTPAASGGGSSWMSSLFSPQAIAAGIGGISSSMINDQNNAEKQTETQESQAFQEQMQEESFAHSDKAQAAALANAKGIAAMQIGYESKRDKENRVAQAYQGAITSSQNGSNLTIQALSNLIKGGQAPLGIR